MQLFVYVEECIVFTCLSAQADVAHCMGQAGFFLPKHCDPWGSSF